jgi:hypothetical protein
VNTNHAGYPLDIATLDIEMPGVMDSLQCRCREKHCRRPIEDIADLLEDRTPDRRRWKHAETWDKGHGRLEHRHIICSPDLNKWFGKQWEGIEQKLPNRLDGSLGEDACQTRTGPVSSLLAQ